MAREQVRAAPHQGGDLVHHARGALVENERVVLDGVKELLVSLELARADLLVVGAPALLGERGVAHERREEARRLKERRRGRGEQGTAVRVAEAREQLGAQARLERPQVAAREIGVEQRAQVEVLQRRLDLRGEAREELPLTPLLITPLRLKPLSLKPRGGERLSREEHVPLKQRAAPPR